MNAAVAVEAFGGVVGEYDAEIEIAVGASFSARFGAEQVDALGAIELDQAAGDLGDGFLLGHHNPLSFLTGLLQATVRPFAPFILMCG